MGCCENRDEETKKYRSLLFTSPQARTPRRTSLVKMTEQDLMVVSDKSQYMKSLYKVNCEESLRLYVEWCRSLKKWEEMVEFIGDFTLIGESKVVIEGATAPKTLATLIVVYLDIELKQDKESVMAVIEVTIYKLIKVMTKGTSDFIENSTYLILDFLQNANEFIIRKLASLGIFSTLILLVNDTTEKNIIKICQVVLNGRECLKKIFFNSDGVELIKKGILTYLTRSENLDEIFNLVEVVFYKDNGEIDYKSIDILKNNGVLDYLCKISHCRKRENLWNILSSQKVLIM